MWFLKPVKRVLLEAHISRVLLLDSVWWDGVQLRFTSSYVPVFPLQPFYFAKDC